MANTSADYLHLQPAGSSSGGVPTKIAATTSTGTEVHRTGTSASVIDEITLYATNIHTAAVQITVEWGVASGGGGSPADENKIIQTIPLKSGDTLVALKKPLSGDGTNYRTVKVFAGTTNVIMISGSVNRIS